MCRRGSCSCFCNFSLCDCKANFKGCLVVITVLAYQALCFVAFVACSNAFSALTRTFYEYVVGTNFPSYCESFVCLYILTLFAEFHIYCQNECVGRAFAAFYREYSILLPLATLSIYIMLFMLSFTQLYTQFEEAHILKDNGTSSDQKQHHQSSSWTWQDFDFLHSGERKESLVPVSGNSSSDQWHVALFLLSLSYVVFCTVKLIEYDTIQQCRRITNQTSCIHCVVMIMFFGVHVITNILYSIPLIIVAFSMVLYESTAYMTFVQLAVVGALSGAVFAVMETKRPWPTVVARAPFYMYENNCRAKTVYAQIQTLLILIFFYSPFRHGKIQESDFTAGNKHVTMYCFAVALNVLHYIKTLIFIVVAKQTHVRRIIQGNINNGMFEEVEDEALDQALNLPDADFGGLANPIGLGPDPGPCKKCKGLLENENMNGNGPEGGTDMNRNLGLEAGAGVQQTDEELIVRVCNRCKLKSIEIDPSYRSRSSSKVKSCMTICEVVIERGPRISSTEGEAVTEIISEVENQTENLSKIEAGNESLQKPEDSQDSNANTV